MGETALHRAHEFSFLLSRLQHHSTFFSLYIILLVVQDTEKNFWFLSPHFDLLSPEERRSWLLLIPLWLLSSSAKAICTNIVTRCILWLSNWLIEALAKITVASYPLGYKLKGILIETKQKEKVPAFRPCGLVDPFLRFSIRAHLTSAMWHVSSVIQ